MREELAAHFAGPVAVNICTRDAQLVPDVQRGVAVRLGPGDDEVTVFVPRPTADRTLANLKDNGQIAVGVGDITNFRMRQLKGSVVRVEEVGEEVVASLGPGRARLIELFTQFFGEGGGRVLSTLPERPIVAVTFRPSGVYDQTPGAGTGGRIA